MERENKFYNYLIGYVKDEGKQMKRVIMENTPEQITAFIIEHQFYDTTITTMVDTLVLTTIVSGFIMDCPNQKFLKEDLLPVLAEVQMGFDEVPAFSPVDLSLV